MKFRFHKIHEGDSYKWGFNFKTGLRYKPEDLMPLPAINNYEGMPVKLEGHPITSITGFETVKENSKPIGSWWSFSYHTGRFITQFRWRSWTYPIIYIGKDTAPFYFDIRGKAIKTK